jgi:DNA topoisomerase-3
MKKNNYRVYTALNVAEKPSVAKSVSILLNGGQPQREDSRSQYNPVFRFDYIVDSKILNMICFLLQSEDI